MKTILMTLAAATIVLTGLPVVAQDAPSVPGNTIDFSPILTELSLALASAAGVALLYLLKLARDWFKAKTGVQIQISDDQIRQVLDKAIQYGIALVLGRLESRARFAVSNAQVAQIANYVIAAVPGALKNFGITPERLQDMIRARIAAWTDGEVKAEMPVSADLAPAGVPPQSATF